jgi:alkanesulfonate monooxygenase SsuD/methylene tetrahydromethanopterin reductase-like flavin-dependent oxidoreductase (luciferase family)
VKPSFGISVIPTAADHAAIVAQVLAAERLGLELVGIQDHPYQRRFLDTFALMADLLARTSRLRFFPDVACLPMRSPAMLAKAAASLDIMSGGRFELGLGAGAFRDAVAGMGGTRRASGEMLPALVEAITIIRAALDVSTERRVVRGEGPYYPVPGYPAGPAPVHRVEIWVGAMAPRALEAIGRWADGWVPGGGISRIGELAALGSRIDDAAASAGRDPDTIRRVLNVSGTITDGSTARDDRGRRPGELAGGGLDGPAELWAETLTDWAHELRIDAFIVWLPEPGTTMIERLAGEVMPAVHEAT